MSLGQKQDRRRERKDRDRTALLLTVAISVITHLAILPPLALYLNRLASEARSERRVQMVSLSRSSWQKNRKIEAQTERRKQQAKDPERERRQRDDDDIRPPGQVVALPPPTESQEPDQADYASEHARKVERETRSRFQTARYLNPTHKVQTGDPTKRDVPSTTEAETKPIVLKADRPGGPKGEGRARQGQGSQLEGDGGGRAAMDFAVPKIEKRDALALRLDSEAGHLKNRSYTEALNGRGHELRLRMGPRSPKDADNPEKRPGPEARQGGSGDQGVGIAALTPNLETLERLSGAPANDFLPNVEEDEATFLNTWRWKHAPFFNRVAESIRRQWNPGPAIARRDPSGNIYGFQDRYTLLRVTITPEGSITQINVAETCGVDFLDREAVLAFKRAEPFANPPKRLFQKEDKYTFFFGFNVDFQTSPFVQFNWRAAP